jgi:HK97 family phage major capsid protein
MEKIAELKVARAAKIDEMSKLVDKMNASSGVAESDQAAYDAVKKDIEDLGKKIERTEQANALKASIALPHEPTGGIITPPAHKFERNSRLKNFAKGEELQALRFGHFMLASMFGNSKSYAFCRENGIEISKAHSEGVNSAGGFFVPSEFSTKIIDLRDAYGYMRRWATVIPMGSDAITFPKRTSGLTAYAVGEAAAITASQTAWSQVRLVAQKWGVLTLLSSELDEDAAINIGDLLLGEIAYCFANTEDTAGFAGDGTNTYNGIKGIRAVFADGLGALAGAYDLASGHDTFAEIDATDINNLMSKLPQYVYMTGKPAFYCSQVAWALVFARLVQGAGGLTKDDITGEIAYRYLGFPVRITPSMPTATTDISDTAMILFGDLSMAVLMGDRRGMTVARSTDYKFAEDQIAIKATERFDINFHGYGDNTTPGPLIAAMGD